MEKLSQEEKSAYMRYAKGRIIDKCNQMKLPLFVQSTAVAFWSKYPKYDIDVVITLACKAGDKDINTDICDLDLADEMNYSFHEPSPYLRMYGLIIILQEKGIIVACSPGKGDLFSGTVDIQELWAKSVRNMERVLLLDRSLGVNEMAISAIELPLSILQKLNPMNVSWDTIIKAREEINDLERPSSALLNTIFRKIGSGDGAGIVK